MPSLRWRLVHLLALCTMAITQPLLSILGDNPTFFTAHDASPAQIIWFSLVIAMVPAAGLGAVEAALDVRWPKGSARIHLVFVAGLGFLFLVQVVDVLSAHWLLVLAVTAVLAAGLVRLYLGFAPIRTVLSVLGATPLLFIGLFLVASPTGDVVFPDDVAAVELGALLDETDLPTAADPATPLSPTDPINARFPAIHMLVFDELPMASLLDGSGEIDSARWPNFARLGATSHLFTNATTVGFTTERAVPALLTGRYETHAAPVYSLYPENLFTLLGDIYHTSSSDPLVDLCPPTVCDGAPPEAMTDLDASTSGAVDPTITPTVPVPDPEPPEDDAPSPLRLLLDDAAIVFGHLAAPAGLDLGLPSIGAAWGDFGGDLADAQADPAPVAAFDLEFDLGGAPDPAIDATAVDADAVNTENTEFLTGLLLADSRVADTRAEFAAISASPLPRLHFLHTLLPHVPWRLHPTGERYADMALAGYFSRWDDDLVTAHAGQQRHLLQLQFVDRLLGEYLDELEAEGIFDSSTVIVTADHGVSFVPGQRARGLGETNAGGIAGVPLFYKLPGQTEPEVHDKPVETIDLLPTIAAQLGVEIPWPVDGFDLFGPEVDRDRAILHPFLQDVPEPFGPVRDAVTADLLDTFGSGTDGSLYALAGLADLIGEPIADLVDEPVGYCWQRDRPQSIPEPDGSTGYVFGSMTGSGESSIDFAVVVGGVLSGTSRTIAEGPVHRIFALGEPGIWAGAEIDDIALHEIVDDRLRPIRRC